jgi:hypothetical protein
VTSALVGIVVRRQTTKTGGTEKKWFKIQQQHISVVIIKIPLLFGATVGWI